jgi:hypothetical protein
VGEVRPVQPARLVCGIIAGRAELFDLAEAELLRSFGPVESASAAVPFTATDYYGDEMGAGLLRKFVGFAGVVDPGRLAAVKLRTNAIERLFAVESGGRLCRRVNLDPGYVTPAKLVLATTKDFAHRVYLADGIYAEVTLNFKKDGVAFLPWTYPDFKSGAYTEFLQGVRRGLMAAAGGSA